MIIGISSRISNLFKEVNANWESNYCPYVHQLNQDRADASPKKELVWESEGTIAVVNFGTS